MSSFFFTVIANESGPVITPVTPTVGQVGVSRVTPIVFRLEHELGVLMTTLTVSVNGTYYVIDGIAQGGAELATDFSGEQLGSSWTIVLVTITLPVALPSPATNTITVVVENDVGGGGGGEGG